jgi:hypothetical protein
MAPAIRGRSHALELGNLCGRRLPAFDRLEHLDEILRLLSISAAHEEVLQAFGLGSGSHANTVVALKAYRK